MQISPTLYFPFIVKRRRIWRKYFWKLLYLRINNNAQFSTSVAGLFLVKFLHICHIHTCTQILWAFVVVGYIRVVYISTSTNRSHSRLSLTTGHCHLPCAHKCTNICLVWPSKTLNYSQWKFYIKYKNPKFMEQENSYDKLTAWAQHNLLPALCGYERIELGVSCKYICIIHAGISHCCTPLTE